MKATRIGTDINPDTFEPVVKYELTFPIEALMDGEALMSREDMIQMLGQELLEALEKAEGKK